MVPSSLLLGPLAQMAQCTKNKTLTPLAGKLTIVTLMNSILTPLVRNLERPISSRNLQRKPDDVCDMFILMKLNANANGSEKGWFQIQI